MNSYVNNKANSRAKLMFINISRLNKKVKRGYDDFNSRYTLLREENCKIFKLWGSLLFVCLTDVLIK